jgi:hypothetical protein
LHNETIMTTTSPLLRFRRVVRCAVFVTAPLAFAAQLALAQTAPPPNMPSAQQNVDPPGRVARLNYMSGTVTTEPAGASDWSYAAVNRPLTTGDQLWNDANGRSELHIGSTAVRLGASTNLDILNLDDTNAQLKVSQGTLSTHVRALPQGSSYEIDTPNVALGVTRPGDYRVDVAPDGSTTTVTVRSGALTAYGDGGQVPLEPGAQVTFTGTNLQTTASDGAPPPDAFDEWAASRDAAEDRSISARYVSRDVPGYEDLDANGTWRSDPQYGEVWQPTVVPAGWAPYHEGHWAWVAPWGWTWVDDAPWGFAPYHYGRWAYVDSSWCWVPGPRMLVAPPVYAPALVAFVGGGGGGSSWSVSLSIGGGSPGVAWFPLGPGDVWHPAWGGWSPNYYRRVNETVINQNVNVTNINVTNIHNTYINYRAPGAVTAVPADAFAHSRPVARFAQKVDPQQWRNAHINPGTPGIAPVRESFTSGLRQANFRPPQAVTARPVVATKAAPVPPALHDQLAARFAQTGGARVPGAGAPVVRMHVPSSVPGELGRPGLRPATSMHLVDARSPVVTPPHAPAAAGEGSHAGPGAPAAPGAVRPELGRPELGRPELGRPEAGRPEAGRPEAGRVEPGRVEPGRIGQPPAANEAHSNNGVPRPPSGGAVQAGGQASPRPAPSWTQPHAPITQGHVPGVAPHAGEQNLAVPSHEMRGTQPAVQVPHPAQPESRGPAGAMNPRSAPQHDVQPQVEPRMQPQVQPQHVEARPQPQFEPRPQPRIEPRPQPTPEVQPHFEPRPQPAPQAQPHFEPRPQPAPQVQPHFEPRPQPAPQAQPHFEPRPQPAPQVQPHFEPRPQPAPAHEQHPPQARTEPEPHRHG